MDMDETTKVIVEGAAEGNPLMMALVVILSIHSLFSIGDKLAFWRTRHKNPEEFDPATKKDIKKSREESREDMKKLRATNHLINNTLQAVVLTQGKEVEVHARHTDQLNSIEDELRELRIKADENSGKLGLILNHT